MRKKSFALSLLATAVVFAFAGVARADGVHIPPPVYLRPAEIPSQRALIAWRDGKETLIVESAFSTEAKDVGWIIPLPAVPDKIQQVSPGALKTLSLFAAPEITHHVPSWLTSVSLLLGAAFCLIFCCTFYRSRLLDLLVILLLLVLLSGMLLPSLSRAGSDGPPSAARGVKVQRQVIVGSYEVSILTTEKPNALNDWLKLNGFMNVPARGAQIVTDYIRKGWCFAAAKLTRTESGLSRPHPIRFDFKTGEPVYPMRLTALSGSSPDLELFVLADKAASAGALAPEFCDIYEKDTESTDDAVGTTDYGWSRSFLGITFGRRDVGHFGQPEIATLFWPGCVLTKLSGRMAPAQMMNDLVLSWREPKPTRNHFYSYRGAFLVACMLGADVVLVLLGIILSIPDRAKFRAAGKWRHLLKLALPCAAAGLMTSVIFFILVPKVDVVVWPHRHLLVDVVADFLDERHLPADASPENGIRLVENLISKNLKDAYPDGSKNEFTGEPIVRGEAFPGNYDIRKINGRLFYIYYDRGGTACWQPMSDAGKK